VTPSYGGLVWSAGGSGDFARALEYEEVVARVLAGETAMLKSSCAVTTAPLPRGSGLFFDDTEAEDVMQDAYVRAYEHLDQYAGKASFPPG